MHYLLLRALEDAGVDYGPVHPVFLAPSEARVAFEGGSVDAWAVWDPYLAEARAGARVLVDGRGLSANREFHLASRAFVARRPDVIAAITEALRRGGEWAQEHPEEIAGLLSRDTGLDVELMRVVVNRRAYRIAPIDEAMVREQQRIADAFSGLGLIPRPIDVREAIAPPGI